MAKLEETLSALIDGECSAAELDSVLDACATQPELLRFYSRQHVVRESLAGRELHVHSESLCAAVMRGIQAPSPNSASPRSLRRLGHSASKASHRRARRRWQAVGGLAMAASLGAVVAVGAYRLMVVPGAGPEAMHVATLSPAPEATPRLASVSLPAESEAGSGPGTTHMVSWSRLDPRTTRQIDDYIMEHAGYGSGQVMGAPLSYARISAHGAQQVSYSPPGNLH